MKAIVDRDTCIGCGLCPQICPQVFEMDDQNLAFVKEDPVPPDAQDEARQAAESCPVDAIAIEE